MSIFSRLLSFITSSGIFLINTASIANPGSARVEGDEEEDDTDDLENEFDIGGNPHHIAEAMHFARFNVDRGSHANNVSATATPSELDSASVSPDIPLLTYGEEVKF